MHAALWLLGPAALLSTVGLMHSLRFHARRYRREKWQPGLPWAARLRSGGASFFAVGAMDDRAFQRCIPLKRYLRLRPQRPALERVSGRKRPLEMHSTERHLWARAPAGTIECSPMSVFFRHPGRDLRRRLRNSRPPGRGGEWAPVYIARAALDREGARAEDHAAAAPQRRSYPRALHAGGARRLASEQRARDRGRRGPAIDADDAHAVARDGAPPGGGPGQLRRAARSPCPPRRCWRFSASSATASPRRTSPVWFHRDLKPENVLPRDRPARPAFPSP